MPLNPNDPRLDTYRSDPHQTGIDLKRSIIKTNPGTFVADTAAQFRMGHVLTLNAAGNVVLCDGTGAAPINIPLGLAKANKQTSLVAVKVDEPVVLVGVVASNLKRGALAITTAGVSVRSLPGQLGTAYVETTDFVVNYTNGQVTRNGGGAIPSGATVFVTYQYNLLEEDLDFQGRNFFNFLDDVTISQNRVTVIQDWAKVYTMMYDPAQTYTQGQQLYVDGGLKAGLLTNVSSGGRPAFGRVEQLPNASDPFLGVRFTVLSP